MKSLLCAVVAIAGLATTHAAVAKRVAVTIGPYSDIKVVNPVDSFTNGYWTYTSQVNVYDFVQANCPACGDYPPPIYRLIQGVQYATASNGNFATGRVVLTTIYGLDQDPDGNQLDVTGYTAGAPEVTYANESFIGASGKVYDADVSEVVSLAELPKVLGSGFDLSPFQNGDPNSVVYVFQTTMPNKDRGTPTKRTILGEDFSGAFHVGSQDPGGSFDVGELPGTKLVVTSGNVDIFGVVNGTSGSCMSNPSGNCMDLIGDMGEGAVQSLAPYDLDPANTYTIEFWTDTGDLGGNQSLDFTASLGSFSSPVTATSTPTKIDLYYTPKSNESGAYLGFASGTDVDGMHGPVLSGILVCAHKVGTRHLNCTK